MSVQQVLENLRSALDSIGVPYMVTGSLVSSVHGVPRATQDIDVVIEPTREQLSALMEYFGEPTYDSDKDDALDALRRRSMFSVIDRRGIWKIDFIVRKERPFSRREFDRRQKVDILGVSLYAATPEDMLLAKAGVGEARRIRAADQRRRRHHPDSGHQPRHRLRRTMGGGSRNRGSMACRAANNALTRTSVRAIFSTLSELDRTLLHLCPSVRAEQIL